jgi:hypothetical protein
VPLSLEDLLAQPATTGSFTGTPGTATLGSATTAGNTVLICTTIRGGTASTPAGFTEVATSSSPLGTVQPYAYIKATAGGETSWSLATVSSTICDWAVFELVGVDPDAPLDVNVTTGTATTSGTSVPTGTTPASTTYDGLKVAIYGAYDSASTTAPTLTAHTNGLVEQANISGTNGTAALRLSVAMEPVASLGAFSSAATSSITHSSTNPAAAAIFVLSAVGAKREANIAFFWAFKVGVGAAGLATGVAGFRYVETMVGSPAITADGLQLASTSAAESVATAFVPLLGAPQLGSYVHQVRFRFDGSLPSVDTELMVTTGGTNGFVLRYVAASQKLGFKISTGSEVVSDATVAADAWYTVDTRVISTGSAQTGDWQVDYGAGPVVQAQASFAGGVTQATTRLGWANAITVPGVTFSHLLISNVAGHYPLGSFTFALLKVDPAATPTISGTTTNFGVMTANGTIAAWNATNARDAVDDWPPVVGASADGAGPILTHATDYVEFPLETYDASGIGSVRAARVVLPMWAATGLVATCRVNGWDGTTSTALFAEADPEADATSTPAWICKMWRPAGGWTQAKLDAAAVRVGSLDPNPDIMPHAVGMEVAVQVAAEAPVIGEAGGVEATEARDPVTGGMLGVTVDTPAGQGATLNWDDGTPGSQVVAPSSTHTETFDAVDASTVTFVEVVSDNEAPDRE